MYLPKLFFRLFCPLTLLLFPVQLIAQDNDQADWTSLKEQWGQVLFCQAIYKMPEVKTRLYSFDVEQCNQAGQLMVDKVAVYPEQDRVRMKTEAEQHAFLLSRNTSEPYHAVVGCREYCSEFAEEKGFQDE